MTRHLLPRTATVALTAASVIATPAAVAATAPDIAWADPVGWVRRAPVEEAIAALAWLVLATCLLTIVVGSALYALAAITRVERALRAVGWMALPGVRRAIDTALAISVSAATLGAPAAMALDGPSPVIYEIVDGVPVPRGEGPVDDQPQEPSEDEATPGIVPPGVTAYTPTPAGGGHERNDTTTQPTDAGSASGSAETHTVVIGDNMWKIACDVVHDADPDAGLGQVAEYWLRVIETNRFTIRSGDPDLIFPGETLILPALEDRA